MQQHPEGQSEDPNLWGSVLELEKLGVKEYIIVGAVEKKKGDEEGTLDDIIIRAHTKTAGLGLLLAKMAEIMYTKEVMLNMLQEDA